MQKDQVSSSVCIQIVDMLDSDALLVQLSDGSTVKITLDDVLSIQGERTASATGDPDHEAPYNGEIGPA